MIRLSLREIADATLPGCAPAAELRRRAIEQGMITLRRSALIKVVAGLTTLDEVLLQTLV
jgi:type IV pilus assembly protein PilB